MRPLAAVLLALAVSACAPRRSEVIVEAATDLIAPDQLDAFRFEIKGGPRGSESIERPLTGMSHGAYELPRTLALYTDNGSTPRFTIDLVGLKSQNELVRRQAVFSLVPGETRFLRMALLARCESVVCPASLTCVDGLCTRPVLTAAQMPVYRTELERSQRCGEQLVLLDTSLGKALGSSGSCAEGEFCAEGLCYPGQPPTAYGFAPAMQILAGSEPLSATIADVTGDGIADVVLASVKSGKLEVLPGNGTIGILRMTQPLTPNPDRLPFPLALISDDFDGDGRADLAVAMPSFEIQTAGRVAVVTAARGYREALTLDVETNAYRLASADFDRDGKADLAIGGNGVRIALGRGDGTFVLTLASGFSRNLVTSLVTADFDRDGNADLAIAAGPVQVYRGDGAGGFTLEYQYTPTNGMVSALAVGDVDADGYPDLAIAAYQGGVVVARGRQAGGFSVSEPTVALPWIAVAVGDLDGDGNSDVVALAKADQEPPAGTVSAFLSNGDGTIREAFRETGFDSNLLLLHPFDGTKPDLLLAGPQSSQIDYLANRFR